MNSKLDYRVPYLANNSYLYGDRPKGLEPKQTTNSTHLELSDSETLIPSIKNPIPCDRDDTAKHYEIHLIRPQDTEKATNLLYSGKEVQNHSYKPVFQHEKGKESLGHEERFSKNHEIFEQNEFYRENKYENLKIKESTPLRMPYSNTKDENFRNLLKSPTNSDFFSINSTYKSSLCEEGSKKYDVQSSHEEKLPSKYEARTNFEEKSLKTAEGHESYEEYPHNKYESHSSFNENKKNYYENRLEQRHNPDVPNPYQEKQYTEYEIMSNYEDKSAEKYPSYSNYDKKPLPKYENYKEKSFKEREVSEPYQEKPKFSEGYINYQNKLIPQEGIRSRFEGSTKPVENTTEFRINTQNYQGNVNSHQNYSNSINEKNYFTKDYSKKLDSGLYKEDTDSSQYIESILSEKKMNFQGKIQEKPPNSLYNSTKTYKCPEFSYEIDENYRERPNLNESYLENTGKISRNTDYSTKKDYNDRNDAYLSRPFRENNDLNARPSREVWVKQSEKTKKTLKDKPMLDISKLEVFSRSNSNNSKTKVGKNKSVGNKRPKENFRNSSVKEREFKDKEAFVTVMMTILKNHSKYCSSLRREINAIKAKNVYEI